MSRRIVTILGYVLGTAIVGLGTILLIAYGNGYSYDFKKGKLIHRGLIILDSTPGGAKITLGNKTLSQKTPYRGTFEAGWYDFTLARDGYRTWHKRLQAIPSQANLAQYVILLPQHIGVDSYGTYPAVSQTAVSRDHRRVGFVVPSGPGAGVWSLDTQSHSQTRLYASASATDDKPAETVQLLSWSYDGSHLLLKSQIGDATTIYLISANGTDKPINLTDSFKLEFGSVIFDPSNWRILYWQNGDGLRRLDAGNQTVSAVLASHVAGYSFASDRILYVDNEKQPASLWSLDRGGHKQQLVKNLPPSASYEISFASYIGTPQAVVVAKDAGIATLYTNLYDHPTSKQLTSPATHASFNGDGRFALIYDDHHVATYDLERDATYSMPELNSSVTGLSWFDNYHLVFNRGGQVVLSEFDGNYAVVITRADALAPFSSSDTKTVIVTSPTSSGTTQIKAVKIRQ